MRLLTLVSCLSLAFVAVPGLVACSSSGTEEIEASGTIGLPLTATTSSGTTYRLSDATFAISGGALTSPLSLSSASNPTVTSLTSDLAPGSYAISLLPGWQMVRVDSTGATTAVTATLASLTSQTFSIADQTVTNVTYRFNVDGGVVETGEGTLQVNLAVNEVAHVPGTYTNGVISGYVYTALDSATAMNPTSYSTVATNGPFCTMGQVGASYSSYAVLGVTTNQTGTTQGSINVTATNTLAYNVTGNVGNSTLRLHIWDGDGNSYCASVAPGAGSVALSQFATQCWDSSGTSFPGGALSRIEVAVTGNATPTAFNFCLNSLAIN